jgi:hypothetical protein
MPLSVSNEKRTERLLKRNIIKRDYIVKQFSTMVELGEKLDEENNLQLFDICSQDIVTLLSRFHVEQDSILDQLIILTRETEFYSNHAPIENQIMTQYYKIKTIMSILNINNLCIKESGNSLC